jgi:hypothetical protein
LLDLRRERSQGKIRKLPEFDQENAQTYFDIEIGEPG